ncbi:ROK family protein [Parasediminibacterium sp. JCM 36343]|uniref:ROK family protein n=1 Tax=Parasediminibacterium sp. JCM 36343 TaxID=3374279 RepID=UPI0039785DF1
MDILADLPMTDMAIEQVAKAENTVLGIDIGGTHITAALVDMGKRAIIDGTHFRGHLDSKGTLENILSAWVQVIKQAAGGELLPKQQIGIAMPGPFDYENGISLMIGNAKYEALYGKNIKTLLAASLGIDEGNIRFINDAAAFLKGEWFAGAAVGYQHAIGITLGTGLGSTTLHHHDVVDADLWCTPFKESIAEDYISSRWFVKYYHSLTGLQVKGAKQIADIYPEDENAKLVFNEFADNLASFLAFFIEQSNPEIVVIGGNIMNGEKLFLPQLKQNLKQVGIELPIVRAKLSEDAAIIGAAALF